MFNSDRWVASWPKRYFYGWCIVAVAVSVSFTQVGEFNPVLAIFMRPLSEEFGWNRAEISAAITFGSLGGAFLAPLVGPLLDRRGTRVVLVIGQIVFGAALMTSAFVTELWQFYISYSVGRAVVQGVTALAVTVAVANWFQRNRALALGITQLGTRAGQAVLPLAIQFLIEFVGWRGAWFFLGILVWMVGVIPSAIFLRHRPEDVGLRTDGDAPAEAALAFDTIPGKPLQEDAEWSLGEARRTPALWLLTLATSLAFLVGAGINLHMAPYLMDQGIPPVQAVSALSLFAATAGVGGLLWGYIARMIPVRFALTILFFGSAAGVALLATVQTPAMAYVFAVFYGICFGGWGPLSSSAWADYYGRRSVGSITGFVSPFQLVANASGPLIGGFLYDRLGNYQLTFALFTAAYALAALSTLLARPPRRRSALEAAPV